MTSLRDARAAAVTRHYRQLADSLTEALPGLLDELEALDRQAMASWRYKVGGVIYEGADVTVIAPGGELAELQAANPAIGVRVKPEAVAPADAELSAWVEAHPAEFEAFAARSARAHPPGSVVKVLGKPAPTEQPKHTTARKPRGGAAT